MTTLTNNNQMHNDIMVAGSKERPPMLATGRYAQQCTLDGPYVMTKVTVSAKLATTTEDRVLEHNVPKTYKNPTPEKRAYIDDEVIAIHMIFSGIRDDIYSIVYACTTAKEIWIAIERLQELIESYYSRFYKMMNEMIRNKLEVATMNKGKEIFKPITPPSESASNEESDEEQAQKDKHI
ncbi:hypothetical protein Tco_1478714 [Tanacetum coccineum]